MREAETKVFNVVYCDSKFWMDEPSLKLQDNMTFRFYLLRSPAVGITDLDVARQMAKELKDRYGSRAQVVIIGEFAAARQFRYVDFDNMLGVTVLQEANAAHCEGPRIIFTRKSKRPVFYSRAEDLRYGFFPYG